jgi:ankyrin repeat protein
MANVGSKKWMTFLSLSLLISSALHASKDRQLHEAIKADDLSSAQAALRGGANANTYIIKNQKTFLMLSMNKQLTIARLLLEHGANPNARDCRGASALIHSVHYNSPDHAELLLQNGARPDLTDAIGVTALMYAASQNKVAILKHLLAYNAKPNLKNSTHWTALTFAINSCHPESVAQLLHSRVTVPTNLSTQIWWWNNLILSTEQKLIKHMIAIATTTTQTEFDFVEEQHRNLASIATDYSSSPKAIQYEFKIIYEQLFNELREHANTLPFNDLTLALTSLTDTLKSLKMQGQSQQPFPAQTSLTIPAQ